ncbi:MAG: ATP-binding protein [Thermoproteus sp.]
MDCGFISRQFPASISLEEAKTYAVLTCDVGVGSFLVVEAGDRLYLARVAGVRIADIYAVANTPVLSPEQELAVGLKLGPKTAELELVSECVKGVCGPPAVPAPIHSRVRPPRPGEVGAMLGLPQDGVVLGSLALPSGDPLPGEAVRLPLEALRHHVLIVGTTGSGKTVLVKELALQLASEARAVALDAVGHFYHLAYNGIHVKVVLPVTRRLARRGYRAIARRAAARAIWKGKGRYKARVYKAPGPRLARIELEVESPHGRGRFTVYPWALESGKVLGNLPRAIPILTQQAKIFYRRVLDEAKKLSGKEKAEDLFAFLTAPAEEQKGRPAVMYEKLGASLGLHAGTMENIVRALLALIETGLVDVEGPGFKVAEPDYRKALSGYSVVDISGLNTHQQRLVVYRVLDAVYKTARPTTAVLIDEAHLFFPQTRSEDEQTFIEAHLTRLTRLGRAKGIAVVFATHMPDDLNDVVIQLANTKVVLRSDQKVLEKLGVPASERRFLASADKGLAYVQSYVYRHPIYVKVQKSAVHLG